MAARGLEVNLPSQQDLEFVPREAIPAIIGRLGELQAYLQMKMVAPVQSLNEWLTAEQVAERYKVNIHTVYRNPERYGAERHGKSIRYRVNGK